MARMPILLKKALSYLPSALPVGMTRMEEYLKEINELAGPVADADSMTWVVCNEVLHLKSTHDTVPKRYFVKIIRKFAANQLAAAKINDIRSAQEAKKAEELAKQKQAEDMAKQETPTSGQETAQ